MPVNTNSETSRFTNSRLWVENHKLALEIFKITRVFSADYKPTLGASLNQEAITISSNVTLALLEEENAKENYLGFAKKRLLILENLLILAKDSENIGDTVYTNLVSLLKNVQTLVDENV